MNTPKVSTLLKIASLFACCAVLGLLVSQGPAARASATATLQPLDDKAASLPLTASFEKVANAEAGPYVLKLENTSKEAIKASAKVLTSTPSHADRKVREVPEHVVEPGQVWSIADLAAGDKVTVTAPGFAPLELTVP